MRERETITKRLHDGDSTYPIEITYEFGRYTIDFDGAPYCTAESWREVEEEIEDIRRRLCRQRPRCAV